MLIKQILSQKSHWQINKDFARSFGIETTIIMTDLLDKWIFHNCPEWLYNTSESIERDTTLSRYKQSQAFKILEKNGFIEKKLMGVPAKLHFKIFENKILNFFKTGFEETSKQGFKKFENSYNKNKDNKNKDNKNKGVNDEHSPSDQFIFPDDLDKIIPKKSEKKEKPSPAPENPELKLPYDSDKFQEAWDGWKEYKLKEFKFRYRTTRSEQAALSQLKNLARSETEAIKIMEQSMANGWKGLFDLKTQNQNQNEKRKPDPRFDDRKSKFEGASKRRGTVKFT